MEHVPAEEPALSRLSRACPAASHRSTRLHGMPAASALFPASPSHTWQLLQLVLVTPRKQS